MQTQLNPTETVVRAKEIYNSRIKGQITEADRRKWLEIDLISGDFEMDADEDAVHDRLVARRPNGHFVIMRADGSARGHFG